MLLPEGRWFHTRWDVFFNLPNPFGRTRPWGFTQPIIEMRTRSIKIIMFLGSKVRRVRRTDNRLSKQCGILNISQPYRPPKPITEISLLFTWLYNCNLSDDVKSLINFTKSISVILNRFPSSLIYLQAIMLMETQFAEFYPPLYFKWVLI
jgi:hypothetical protein